MADPSSDNLADKTNWHALPSDEVLVLQQTATNGLTQEEAARRLEQYGQNQLTPPPKTSFLMRLFLQINNVLIYILVAAATLSGILEEWKEVALICAVVIINVSIGLIQEGRAEKAADAIKKMLSSNAMVLRGGVSTEIAAADLVPGDVVTLKAGDQVPADLRLFEVYRLQVKEEMLTGETMPVTKQIDAVPEEVGLGDRKCLAFSATMVLDGEGKGVVIGTGDYAEIGRINRLVGTVEDMKTNLLVQLEIFGRWICLFVAVIAAVTFCLAFIVHEESAETAFKSAVAIAVAIIPEGLPAVVTISLAIATELMARQNAIIKKLPAIETLGSLTVICSDKTGTLTKNEMTVQEIHTSKSRYSVQGVGYQPEGKLIDSAGSTVDDEGLGKLCRMLEGSVLANNSGLEVENVNGRETYVPVGYPTEVSLLTLILKLGVKGLPGIKQLKDEKPKVNGVPFASEHKFMCSVHAESTAKGAALVCHVKGAPDRLIKLCKDQVVEDDLSKTKPIQADDWTEAARSLASTGLRTLAVCRAEWPDARRAEEMEAETILKAEPFLTMVAIVGILDPPRPEAIEGIKVAHGAGIVVKMITGDHPETAIAIGRMLGLVDPTAANLKAYTGPELDAMNDEQLEGIVLDCDIFARASPENKISIVKALQKRGQTTSMTGDGVNDAPALKAANIGVAMGITGTDVSKEAAKMVLADDNFATIVAAVREGRRVWDNLVKILLYNMPVNLAQGLSVFFSFVISMESVPLTAMQVLYVNMITSVTMGLMLAMEPAEATVMTRKPRRKDKRLFGKLLVWHCIYVTAIMVTCVLVTFNWNLRENPIESSGDDGPAAPLLNATSVSQPVVINGTGSNSSIFVETMATTPPSLWNVEGADGFEEMGVGAGVAGPTRRVSSTTDDPRINRARTEAFNMLVFAEIAYAINCRFVKQSSIRVETITGNKWCWVAISITACLQFFLTYTPGVNDVFHCAPIGASSWARIFTGMVMVFFANELMKALGPRFLLPIIRPIYKLMMCCMPASIKGPERSDAEQMQNIRFLATSASTIGMPTPHQASFKGVRRSGTLNPVSPNLKPTSSYTVNTPEDAESVEDKGKVSPMLARKEATGEVLSLAQPPGDEAWPEASDVAPPNVNIEMQQPTEELKLRKMLEDNIKLSESVEEIAKETADPDMAAELDGEVTDKLKNLQDQIAGLSTDLHKALEEKERIKQLRASSSSGKPDFEITEVSEEAGVRV